MFYRETTPPNQYYVINTTEDVSRSGGSKSSRATSSAEDWSPATILTAATSPPASPFACYEAGSRLLPKPRVQDRVVAPGWPSTQSVPSHSRTVSLPSNQLLYGSTLPHTSWERRSASPGIVGHPSVVVASGPPAIITAQTTTPPPTRPTLANHRSASTSMVHSHSRNASTPTAGELGSLALHYRPGHAGLPPGTGLGLPRVPKAMDFLTPIALPDGSIPSYRKARRTASPPAAQSPLSSMVMAPQQAHYMAPDPFVSAATFAPGPTTTMLEYLTCANPAPDLTLHPVDIPDQAAHHAWFGVRNKRAWSDFSIDSIKNMPRALDLLKVDVDQSGLPNPGRINHHPENVGQLAESCAKHYAYKTNAALKMSQGSSHIIMHQHNPVVGGRPQPDFVSCYPHEDVRTVLGAKRGRVVGLVKSYHSWDSGLWSGNDLKKIKYLKHLAQLHHHMREHGTRYGFIITETELVCVRMGGAPQPNGHPLFGYLEIAEAVQLSASGREEDGSLKMTAGLALWYLHMLAREDVLDGQLHWRVNVGAPQMRSRQYCLEVDAGIPKPLSKQLRTIKVSRGWALPTDELNQKKECPKQRRARARNGGAGQH